MVYYFGENKEVKFSSKYYFITNGIESIKLSAKESEVLEILCKEPNITVNRNYIQDTVWPGHDNASLNLNNSILSLRRKLSKLGLKKEIISTIPKVGYLITCKLSEDIAIKKSLSPTTKVTTNKYRIQKKHCLIFIILIITVALPLVWQSLNRYHVDSNNLSHLTIHLYQHSNYDDISPLLNELNNEAKHINATGDLLLGDQTFSLIITKEHKKYARHFLLSDDFDTKDAIYCFLSSLKDNSLLKIIQQQYSIAGKNNFVATISSSCDTKDDLLAKRENISDDKITFFQRLYIYNENRKLLLDATYTIGFDRTILNAALFVIKNYSVNHITENNDNKTFKKFILRINATNMDIVIIKIRDGLFISSQWGGLLFNG